MREFNLIEIFYLNFIQLSDFDIQNNKILFICILYIYYHLYICIFYFILYVYMYIYIKKAYKLFVYNLKIFKFRDYEIYISVHHAC